jgi:DNA replication and repair protein RecF
VRSFRNLGDAGWEIPDRGMALVGPNGHGKTNLLEALAYPVLFRSLRGARDRDVAAFKGPGFFVELGLSTGLEVSATWSADTGRKRVMVAGSEEPRIMAALGNWVAVAFLPSDPVLVSGGAAERRRWLDRLLSLSDPAYLESLLRYRAALAQRNAGLRQGAWQAAEAFEGELARHGSAVVRLRQDWIAGATQAWRNELEQLGEPTDVAMRYRGDESLADAARWPASFAASRERDQVRGVTHVGPQRDDLVLQIGGRSFREFGSTGQQRTAAIGLRLVELETLARNRITRPALLVDDVFAELDHERQDRLARRLTSNGSQLVVTAPRYDDLPPALELDRWRVMDGKVNPE